MSDIASILSTAFILVPPLFVAIVLHEIAHGYVAEQLGDPTAREAGRINLDPRVHIHPVFTIIVPIALLIMSKGTFTFGAARPVPVDPRYFKNPQRGMLLVALAGPVTNFILALLCVIYIEIIVHFSRSYFVLSPAIWEVVLSWANYGLIFNVILGVFNLIPIPPLDGGRILMGIVSPRMAYYLMKVEPYGLLILILFIASGGAEVVLRPFDQEIFSYINNRVFLYQLGGMLGSNVP